MKFENIPKVNAQSKWSYIDSSDSFYKFIDDFDLMGVCWSQPLNISASYFLRILQEGASAKARGYGKLSDKDNDEASIQMLKYYTGLMDHGALWKQSNGNVICTAMPYGDKESIEDSFRKMVKEFHFPDSIKFAFLDEQYRYRSNGNYMICFYCEDKQEELPMDYSEDKLRKKAIENSSSARRTSQILTASYNRDKYVSEYAKRRAHGICQLCGNPAPFIDKEGNPFLETHHIVWLSQRGKDSVDNTVALCPNCHKKMHVLDDKKDKEKLLQTVCGSC